MSDISHTQHTADDHGHGDVNMVKLILQTLAILSIITVVEVVIALLAYNYMDPRSGGKMAVRFFFVAASIAKAYYIVRTFMHMRFEVKNLVVTILVPFIFLIYAVIMLLWEGDSWLHMRMVH